MNKHLIWRGTIVLFVLLAGCGPAGPATLRPQSVPSPSGAWTAKLTQSGGFIGVLLTVEVSRNGVLTAEDLRSGQSLTTALPPDTIAQLDQMISNAKAPVPGGLPSGCADCFNYTLDLISTRGAIHVQVDDTTIAASGFEPLINLLQHLRDDALRARALPSQRFPAAPGTWTAQLIQSGCIAGMLLTVEASADGQLKAEDQHSGRSAITTLPPDTIAPLDQMISNANAPVASGVPSGCAADCMTYTLDLTSTRGVIHVHADDTTLGSSGFEPLIKLLQQLRDDALHAKP